MQYSKTFTSDVNAKVKKLIRKTGQLVKSEVSPLLPKLLLPADISELPSTG